MSPKTRLLETEVLDDRDASPQADEDGGPTIDELIADHGEPVVDLGSVTEDDDAPTEDLLAPDVLFPEQSSRDEDADL